MLKKCFAINVFQRFPPSLHPRGSCSVQDEVKSVLCSLPEHHLCILSNITIVIYFKTDFFFSSLLDFSEKRS